jgi:YidC/Oxa1 family membrane protein insertase
MTTALLSTHAAGMLAKSSGITLDPIAKPLAAVLAFFYSIVPNYGIAIVMLTVAMMIVLTPLSIKQTRSMLVMQKLQPQLKRLQETHKNDRQAMNEAVMALYKEHGASPLGGCLPMLLPLPVFIALLRVLEGLSRKVSGVSHPKYLTSNTRMYQDIVHAMGKLDAFGMDLAKSARTINGSFLTKLPYFVLLLLMVGTQYYQQAQLTSRNPQASSQPGQAAMMKFIPLFFGLISIQFPAGVVIYWTVSNMIRILSQSLMYRYDPKVKALVSQDIKEVEARAKEIGDDAAEDQPPGRPRFRDLLSGAANSLSGKDGDGNKGGTGAAKPGGRPGTDKAGPTGKNGPSKSGSGNKPSAGGQKQGTAKPASSRSGNTKPGTPRAGTAKQGSVKPGTLKPGATRPATNKPAGAKPGGGTAGGGGRPGGGSGSGSGGGGAGSTRSGGAKPNAATPPKSGTGSGSGPNGAAGKPGSPATPLPASAKPADGKAAADPAVSGSNGAGTGNGGPTKGRTGAGSARNVGRHRRTRKGR